MYILWVVLVMGGWGLGIEEIDLGMWDQFFHEAEPHFRLLPLPTSLLRLPTLLTKLLDPNLILPHPRP